MLMELHQQGNFWFWRFPS